MKKRVKKWKTWCLDCGIQITLIMKADYTNKWMPEDCKIDMGVDEQITWLNTYVMCALRPSPIHGIGVFALRDIRKGEYVYCSDIGFQSKIWYKIPLDRFDEIRPEVRQLILDRWPQVEHGRPFMSPNGDQNLLSFMNHSNKPNYVGYPHGLALMNIKAGEEITEDYDTGNLSEIQKQHYDFLAKD